MADEIEKELNVRKFVHRKIMAKDKHYQAFKSIHMSEASGVITVEWVDRDGQTQRDQFQYQRT